MKLIVLYHLVESESLRRYVQITAWEDVELEAPIITIEYDPSTPNELPKHESEVVFNKRMESFLLQRYGKLSKIDATWEKSMTAIREIRDNFSNHPKREMDTICLHENEFAIGKLLYKSVINAPFYITEEA
jgi:hypothetical protein